MKIIGYFGTYADARAEAKRRGIEHPSIQHAGQGWQPHPWVLMEA